jgi:hypothetical protein
MSMERLYLTSFVLPQLFLVLRYKNGIQKLTEFAKQTLFNPLELQNSNGGLITLMPYSFGI